MSRLEELKRGMEEYVNNPNNQHFGLELSSKQVKLLLEAISKIAKPVDDNVQRANSFAIGVLSEKLKEYESTYRNAIDVKERIEREPEEFTWKWAEGGYWVSVYNTYPQLIKELIRAIRALRQMKPTHAYCFYCGQEYPLDSDPSVIDEHVRQCPKHPHAEFRYRADELEGELSQLKSGMPVGDYEGAILRLKKANASHMKALGNTYDMDDDYFNRHRTEIADTDFAIQCIEYCKEVQP
jgi:hypothetical protein